jgi:hypothetical protein
MKVLVVSAGHPDLVAGEVPRLAHALFAGLRASAGVQAVFLASVDRSLPALFKPGAHITAFDARPDEYLFLSHDVDPWWHRNGEPLLVEAFAEFLLLIRPEVVHFHHFATFGADLLTLTRRVLPACRIVFTFQDFLAICAADGRMIRLTDGSPCDHASPVRCHQCFPAVPPERFFLRTAFLRAHLAAVDVFVAPDPGARATYVRWGVPAEEMVDVSDGAATAERFLRLYVTM